jgi:hypothetical protein
VACCNIYIASRSHSQLHRIFDHRQIDRSFRQSNGSKWLPAGPRSVASCWALAAGGCRPAVKMVLLLLHPARARVIRRRTHCATAVRAVCGCAGSAAHPSAWQKPVGTPVGLSLKNSLTGTSEELIVPSNRPLTWYSCGPTVYDAAHLGHARNYICLDVLHRVLTVRIASSSPPRAANPLSPRLTGSHACCPLARFR